MAKQGVDPHACVFIVHEFLPAVAGAWAEADPDGRIVDVDALWGLPDGLQYLNHDSFEFDVKTDLIVAEHIRFKDWFLAEQPNGTWKRERILRHLSRHSCISRADVTRIGQATHELARRTGHPLRVMWFVGVQAKQGQASTLPWFCHQPKLSKSSDLFIAATADRSIGLRLPRYEVRSHADLIDTPKTPHLLRLNPEAQFMRDNTLLEALADVAKSSKHSVELRGSGLCHAYYLLDSKGVAVITPNARRHRRTRRRQTFGKLVRDRIPERIVAKGERVRSFELPLRDRRRALLAKVMEEAQEVAASTNKDDVRAELADLLEIVRSLAWSEGVPWSELQTEADAKSGRVGSFADGKMLLETDLPVGLAAEQTVAKSLSELARPQEAGSAMIIPFLGLIEDAIEFRLGDRIFRMTLRLEGIHIEEVGAAMPEEQLNLPYGS